MNAGMIQHSARGSSASSEARKIMADWLKTIQVARPGPDARTILAQRYPRGLLNDAELDALATLL